MPRLILAFALLVLAAGTVKAAVSKDDAKFFETAAVAGMFEVKASELAEARGTAASVKSFASMMVNDHGKANEQLKTLAGKKGATLPAALDAEHTKMLEKLTKTAQGKEFDEAYADMMEDGHDKAVALFEDASKSADDPDVQKWATETLPTLKMHSEKAEKLDLKNIAP